MRRGRVHGPYSDGGSWRVVVVEQGKRATRKFASKAEAAAFKAAVLAEIAKTDDISTDEALERYRTYMTTKGNKPQSVIGTINRLTGLLGGVSALAQLTPRKAASIYDQLVAKPSKRTGRPLSVDSHRNLLAECKTFGRWCAKGKLLPADPFASVEGVGRRSHGKPQLRLDEARAWCRKAYELADLGDQGAVAALVTLLLALRAGEVIARVARDVDDGGRLLWVPDSKSPAGRRQLEIPAELQGYLRSLASGKRPHELLFGQHWRDWPRKQVQRICALAKVPTVCAHSMRGLHSTLAIRAGATPHLVAASLGHESPTTTLESYAQPGSAQHGQQRVVYDRLKSFPGSSLSGIGPPN